MNGYDCYLKYVAIKAHFSTEKYDYIKNNGRLRANISTYNKRNDIYFFEKLTKILNGDQLEVEKYLVSVFINKNPSVYIQNCLSDNDLVNYQEYQKIINSIDYLFEYDIKKIFTYMVDNKCSFKYICNSDSNGNSIIIKMLMSNYIRRETFIVIEHILNLFEYMDKMIEEDLLYPQFKLKCLKYKSFLVKHWSDNKIKQLKEIFKRELQNYKKS